MTKKVTFVVNEFPVLSETFVIEQVCALIDKGFDVNILACKKTSDANLTPKFKKYKLDQKLTYLDTFARGAKGKLQMLISLIKNFHLIKSKNDYVKALFYSVKNKNLSSLRQLAICAQYAETRFDSDFVICHFLPNGHLAYALRKFSALHCDTIATIAHGYDISLYKVLSKWHYEYSKLVAGTELLLPISERWADLLINKFNAEPAKVKVQHMGVNINNFSFAPRNISPENGPVKLIAVGRATEKKGLEYAIKAVSRTENTHLSIVGGGELLTELEQLAYELNATDKVTLLGPLPHENVLKLLAESHVFILPSVTAKDGDMEGIPVALMEAMASGMLVLSTNHSGIPELIEHKKSGLLADERSVEQLVHNINYVVNSSRSMEKLIENARQKVERDFNNKELNEKLANLIINS